MPRCSRLVGTAESGKEAEEYRDNVDPTSKMQGPVACLPDGNREDTLRFGSGSSDGNSWSATYGSSRMETTLAEHLESEKVQGWGSHEAHRKSMPELYSGAKSENMQDSGKETWKTERADAMKITAQSLRDQHFRRAGIPFQQRSDIAAADVDQRQSSWITTPTEAALSSSGRMNNRTINRRSGVNHWSVSDPSFLQEKEFPQWPVSPQIGKTCQEKKFGLDAWRACSLPRAMSVKEGNQRPWGCNCNESQQGCDARNRTRNMFDRMPAAMEPDSRNSMQESNLGAMWIDAMHRSSRPPTPAQIPQGLGPKAFVQKSGSPSVGTQSASRTTWEKLLKHRKHQSGEQEKIASVQNSQSLRYNDHGGNVGSTVFEGRSNFARRGKQMSFDADDASTRRRPRSMMQKANSMREGGAHADAVSEMAQAYSHKNNGVEQQQHHRILECALCGRGLGVMMQGSLQVGMSFCQTCQPSPIGWRRYPTTSTSADEVAPKQQKKTKKQGIIMQFCRKMLRLDKKQGSSN